VPKTLPALVSQGYSIDARKLTTRQLNSSIKSAVSKRRKSITILNPDARHNLAVGIVSPCNLSFAGSVGYYCCSYCDGVNATIEGNSGWGLGDNLMSGRIVVKEDAGASVGASMRGGEILVWGDAGARAGISMKGGSLMIAGKSGFLTGFMLQKGRIIVLGDVGDAAGDSMYEGVVYVGGEIDSLGADAKVESTTRKEDAELKATLKALKIRVDLLPTRFRKIVSAKKLYHYDSLEPLERERLVI
jgi:glutamate synthase domain-containing protein 3